MYHTQETSYSGNTQHTGHLAQRATQRTGYLVQVGTQHRIPHKKNTHTTYVTYLRQGPKVHVSAAQVQLVIVHQPHLSVQYTAHQPLDVHVTHLGYRVPG